MAACKTAFATFNFVIQLLRLTIVKFISGLEMLARTPTSAARRGWRPRQPQKSYCADISLRPPFCPFRYFLGFGLT
jgi:hypothetical protein